MVGGPVCLLWLGALGRVVALREVLDETWCRSRFGPGADIMA